MQTNREPAGLQAAPGKYAHRDADHSDEDIPLSPLEITAVIMFVKHTKLPWPAAVRFVAAKDFDVEQAMQLHENCLTCSLDPGQVALTTGPMWPLILNPVFYYVGEATDGEGGAVLYLNVRFWNDDDEAVPKLQWLVRFLGDRIVEKARNVRNGLTLVSNAAGASEQVVLSDVHLLVTEMFLLTTPVRLKRLCVVNVPWYISMLPNSLAVMGVSPVSETIGIPVEVCSLESLKTFIQPDSLLEELGGNIKYNHEERVGRMVEVNN
ncbi:hypothetical protein HK101_005936 [Irineochytrium annulatum]|nr:hypothetical protein HK101_005936 [Irineochytrium annulatum]